MSSGLVVDDIIMNMISNNVLGYHQEGGNSLFKNIENKSIYMYRGSLQDFLWKKETHESLDVPCVHFNVEIIQMIQHTFSTSYFH